MNTLALCIPAFNAAAFLPRLLSSACNQIVPFDEILVYDDCSTDDTVAVAQRFGARVICGDRNLGCSAGKNRLLATTTCNWVHFHDADDDLLPAFTQLAHAWMKKLDGPDVVLFDYESRRFEDDSPLQIRHFDAEALRNDPARYAIRQQINPYCGLYRVVPLREVGGYDEDPAVLYNEDCRFHMRLAFARLKFDAENSVAIVNLERAGSMSSSNKLNCSKARLVVLRKAATEADFALHADIGHEAWLNARHLAYFGLRETSDAIRLAIAMGVSAPIEERSVVFSRLVRLAPRFMFYSRARYIKWRDRSRRADLTANDRPE